MCSNRIKRLERILTGLVIGAGLIGSVSAYEMYRLKNKHHHFFYTNLLPRIQALEQKNGILPKEKKFSDKLISSP